MRASFPPTPLHVAVLLGWTVYGAVRERLAELEAWLRRRPARPDVARVDVPPVSARATPPRAGPSSPARQPDYSIN